MMDVLLVHDDLTTPQSARHSNAHDTQTTPSDAASNTRTRLLTLPHAAHRPRCPCTHLLKKWPFWPSGTRDHDAQRSPAHACRAAGERAAARLAHKASLTTACERSGAHATVGAIKSPLTPGGNAMNTGTGIISCICATLPACTLFLLFCAGRFALTTRVRSHRSHRLRA